MKSDPDVLAVLRRKDAFTRNPFCWITNPGDVVEPDAAKPQPPDFGPVFGGQRAVLLECLQTHLAHRWIKSERAKGQIGDWKKMRQQGQAEFVALRNFLQAADEARRTDLARFVLRTNAAVLQSDMTPVFWTGGLQGSGPPCDWPTGSKRNDPHRPLPRQMETLARLARACPLTSGTSTKITRRARCGRRSGKW